MTSIYDPLFVAAFDGEDAPQEDDEEIIMLEIKYDPSEEKQEAKPEEPKKETPKKVPPVRKAPEKKAEPAKKPAPAAKPAEKKPEPAKKPAPAKPAEKKPAEKKPAEKAASKPAGGAAYHVSKRASDNKWQVFIAGSDKVIKLFNTKTEAEAWVNEKAESTGRAVLVHASKGKNKGKIQK